MLVKFQHHFYLHLECHHCSSNNRQKKVLHWSSIKNFYPGVVWRVVVDFFSSGTILKGSNSIQESHPMLCLPSTIWKFDPSVPNILEKLCCQHERLKCFRIQFHLSWIFSWDLFWVKYQWSTVRHGWQRSDFIKYSLEEINSVVPCNAQHDFENISPSYILINEGTSKTDFERKTILRLFNIFGF